MALGGDVQLQSSRLSRKVLLRPCAFHRRNVFRATRLRTARRAAPRTRAKSGRRPMGRVKREAYAHRPYGCPAGVRDPQPGPCVNHLLRRERPFRSGTISRPSGSTAAGEGNRLSSAAAMEAGFILVLALRSSWGRRASLWWGSASRSWPARPRPGRLPSTSIAAA